MKRINQFPYNRRSADAPDEDLEFIGSSDSPTTVTANQDSSVNFIPVDPE